MGPGLWPENTYHVVLDVWDWPTGLEKPGCGARRSKVRAQTVSGVPHDSRRVEAVIVRGGQVVVCGRTASGQRKGQNFQNDHFKCFLFIVTPLPPLPLPQTQTKSTNVQEVLGTFLNLPWKPVYGFLGLFFLIWSVWFEKSFTCRQEVWAWLTPKCCPGDCLLQPLETRVFSLFLIPMSSRGGWARALRRKVRRLFSSRNFEFFYFWGKAASLNVSEEKLKH